MSTPGPDPELAGLADEAVSLARRWLEESRRPQSSAAPADAATAPDAADTPEAAPAPGRTFERIADAGAKAAAAAARLISARNTSRLAALLRDPNGLAFARGFIDRVVRPDDLDLAAREFERLSRIVPRTLPWWLRAAVLFGGGFAPLLPRLVVPAARRVLRGMVAHLVLDATPESLAKRLARLRADGSELTVNLLGEAVVGRPEADRRLAGIHALLERDDVDAVSVKLSSVVNGLSAWGFDESVDTAVHRLTPLYEAAASASRPKRITLDMEEYRDLDLTVAVFTRLLEQPALQGLEAGIVLQAYLPDALAAMQRLTAWAIGRREAGGAGIRVRLVKGANLPMELVDARTHGWPPATLPSRLETDANYKRVLDWALEPGHSTAVRIGVASHNLFELAFARLLAVRRGVADRVEFEMLLGMAPAQAAAVAREVGSIRLYTPLVAPDELPEAIGYLMRRLEEAGAAQNFISAIGELTGPAPSAAVAVAREEERFRQSIGRWLDLREQPAPTPNRVAPPAPVLAQDAAEESAARRASTISLGPADSADTPVTDPAVPANRQLARMILDRSTSTSLGVAGIAAAEITTGAGVEQLIADAAAGPAAVAPTEDRPAVADRVAATLAAERWRLIEILIAETGALFAEADAEVSAAVDLARHHAAVSRALRDQVQAAALPAAPLPVGVAVVAPSPVAPVTTAVDGVVAAWLAGASVVLSAPVAARRTTAVLTELLWGAGVPHATLRLAAIDDDALAEQLLTHPGAGRAIVHVAPELAARLRVGRPRLPLIARGATRNAIVVTPAADLERAVTDVMASAFGRAGQHRAAVSTVILVGSVAHSPRFRIMLADAVRSLRVGWPTDAAVEVGPLLERATGRALRRLTALGEGEHWLVEPKPLDVIGRLWSPGVRDGVRPGSDAHLAAEPPAPVLGIMTAETLDEAIELQNAPGASLAAGLHSLDPDEVHHWADRVDAANLFVACATTGARPGWRWAGGWGPGATGAGASVALSDAPIVMSDWRPLPHRQGESLSLEGIDASLTRLIIAAQPGMDFTGFDRVRHAARSDSASDRPRDGWRVGSAATEPVVTASRRRPVPMLVRLIDGGDAAEFVRVLVAAAAASAPVAVSTPRPLPASLVTLFHEPDSPLCVLRIDVESDAAFLQRVRRRDAATPLIAGVAVGGIRIVGDTLAAAVAEAVADALVDEPQIAVYAGQVTAAGSVELLPFVRAQTLTVTAHRHGTPDPGMLEVFERRPAS